MILLDNHHAILLEVLQARIAGEHADAISLRVADFDGASYHVWTAAEDKSVLHVSLALRCYAELAAYGAADVLRAVFADQLLDEPEQGYDVTLRLDMAALAADADKAAHALANVPLLKRHAMAAPFHTAFAAQADKTTSPVLAVNFREGESIFLQAQPDRVTVIFATQFKEDTDRMFAKVFLQEFVDARRQPSCMNAPSVLYTPRDPPLELRGLDNVPAGDNVGYVTFVLFPQHFADVATRDATISRIQLFRDYLHYHIKCSKAYMHSRMRARVDTFLKVLNRAKPEAPSGEKKTASGRTFVRRA
ncbi:Arp complex subunit [Blastocladiella emersonii ATCC 22665]|nr:Arp complex subunit [Blastocladiella emersonii ATCC 22665]